MDIKGAKVLITGGSSGIGRATAMLLKEQGANVMICGRDAGKLEETGRELGVAFSVADVSNEEDVSRLFENVQRTLGGLDVLVNNAGRGSAANLVDLDIDDFTGIWQTNVKGAVLCAKQAAAS